MESSKLIKTIYGIKDGDVLLTMTNIEMALFNSAGNLQNITIFACVTLLP